MTESQQPQRTPHPLWWIGLFVALTVGFVLILQVVRGPQPDPTAIVPQTPTVIIPPSVVGLWEYRTAEGTLYVYFGSDGEFRASDNEDALFDRPSWVGTFSYDAGALTLNTESRCPSPGQYRVEETLENGLGIMGISTSADDCPERAAVFGDTYFVAVNSEDQG